MSKVHKITATPKLAIIFLLKSQLLGFYDHLANLRSSASDCNDENANHGLLRWLSNYRERLTNFDNTLCLLKQLFALKMGYWLSFFRML